MAGVTIQFVDLLLVSLTVGGMFGVWLGLNPKHLSPSAYVEQQQNSIRGMNTPMPILGAACILLTIVLAVLHAGQRWEFLLLIAAAACFAVSGLVTRFLNQPINSQVMTWSAQNPPANWQDLRDRWWRRHIVRTLTGITGLSLLILATLIEYHA